MRKMNCNGPVFARLLTSVVISALFLCTGPTGAQAPATDRPVTEKPPVKPPDGVPALERDRKLDPHLVPSVKLTTPSRKALMGAHTSIQANVSVGGLNVLGDAANEPSIAVDPTAPNRIVVGWRQFDTILSNFRQAGFASSVDGGRTWSGMNVIEPGVFRSDPVLSAGAGGEIYYLSLGITPWPGGPFLCDLFTSHDGGVTWPDKSFAFGGDKSWIAVDLTLGIGSGNIYQAWNTAANQFPPNQFNRSVDGGALWQDPETYVPTNPGLASPVRGQMTVGLDGAVYVAGVNAGAFPTQHVLVKSLSAQDALSSVAFELISVVDMGGTHPSTGGPNPAGLIGQINVAVDHSGGATAGNIYVLSSINPPGTDPSDVMIATSSDGGLTFSPAVRVNDDPIDINAWQWFGTMSVAPNGRIDVVWNDTRGSGLINQSRLYYSFSTDGGATWSPNEILSPEFDSFVGWPNQNKLGDYYDMISDNVGAHLIWAATFNGEQDVYYLRIGDYDCNGNGFGDTADIGFGVTDCNGNGIPDTCEIAAASSADINVNEIPDECDLARGDSDLDGEVGILDFLAILAHWGSCPSLCPEDADLDGSVGILDFLNLLANWG